MKIAIFSDIHGNSEALKNVLAEVKKENIKHCFVAGDLIGYYYSTGEVFKLLEEFESWMCKGNHEELFFQWKNKQIDETTLFKKYGHSFEVNNKRFTTTDLQKLENLEHPVKFKLDEKNIILSHGSPWNINEYIYPDTFQKYYEKLSSYSNDCDLLIIGHTHHQINEKINNMIIVNPGSLGQPRTGSVKIDLDKKMARAHWAIYDTISHQVELKQTEYSFENLFQEVQKYDKNLPYLYEVFLRRDA